MVHDKLSLVDVRRGVICGKALAESALLAPDVTDRRCIFRKIIVHSRPNLVPDGVHSRHLNPAQSAEEASLSPDADRHIVLVIEVGDIGKPVFLAPHSLLFEEVLREELRPYIPVISPETFLVFVPYTNKKAGKIFCRVVALDRGEFLHY